MPPQLERIPKVPVRLQKEFDRFNLTPRECGVVHLMMGGLTTKAVGAELQISLWTVAFHTRNARKKIGAVNLVQAVYRLLLLAD
jgi:LuxR family quorum sensing-dependent transcriptional regulator